jgi:surface polysaccharide O-acyltransferase-like enzyme
MDGKLPENPRVLLYNFTLGKSFYHLYFMAIVIQFYLFFPLLQKIRSGLAWWTSLILSAVICNYLLGTSDIPLVTGVLEKVMMDRVFFFHWIFYFIFGGYMAHYWKPISIWAKKNTLLLVALLIITYVGAVVEYNLIGYVSSRRFTNFFNIPLLSIATVGLYKYIAKLKLVKSLLQSIGKLSMGIYLIHPFTLIILEKVLPHNIWQTEMMPLMFFIVLIVTLGLVKLVQQLPKAQFIIPVPTKKRNTNTNQTIQRKPVSA